MISGAKNHIEDSMRAEIHVNPVRFDSIKQKSPVNTVRFDSI